MTQLIAVNLSYLVDLKISSFGFFYIFAIQKVLLNWLPTFFKVDTKEIDSMIDLSWEEREKFTLLRSVRQVGRNIFLTSLVVDFRPVVGAKAP